MSHNITIEGGTSKRLPVAGKYCDRDIVVTATGGTPTLQSKTVTPTETAQTVMPDAGYDGLEKVDVNAIPDQYLAEDEVTAQDTLIADIMTALEGKAAGGGGASVETCTVIVNDGGMTNFIIYTEFANGEFRTVLIDRDFSEYHTLNNVVKGSSVFVGCGDSLDWDLTGAVLEDGPVDVASNIGGSYLFKIQSDATIVAE